MASLLSRADPTGSSGTPGSRVSAIIICNTVLIVASTLGLLVRFGVRFRYLGGIGWDDAFCAIGWVFTFVECLVCMLMTQYGYGKHIDTVHSEYKLGMFLKLDFVTEITYLLALGTIKISFCLFYLKIFPGNRFRLLCWALIGLLVAETVEETMVVIFQCWPVQKAWDASGTMDGKCLQLLTFYYISFGIRLATDIAIFTLPIPKLLQLKMTIGKRAGLIFMFSLGVLVVVTSIIRVTYLNNFSKDHTWTLIDPLNWSSVELGVAIFIACFPSFKALITFRFPGLRRVLGLSSDRSYRYNGRYEMYGTSGRRTGDRRSYGGGRSHTTHGHSKLGDDTTTRTQTEVEASRNDSEEHIISESSAGIQVTTDVSVNRLSAGPSSTGASEHGHWPLGP
ncbi:hypothetical protein N7492_003179 [Penicillium capsulatum]|uniref:Rhodopsin domain-containing protein n=1 Tax=Penicillium capsulatum TaxID=69766 RepID=A0A9W9IJ49_9EURO|nr:hypothetical protein N7492_003179 [Penicillium capsulatum]KAJ6122232.1 hypothetical protein N7512_004697 [Penicillium capsulatum]